MNCINQFPTFQFFFFPFHFYILNSIHDHICEKCFWCWHMSAHRFNMPDNKPSFDFYVSKFLCISWTDCEWIWNKKWYSWMWDLIVRCACGKRKKNRGKNSRIGKKNSSTVACELRFHSTIYFCIAQKPYESPYNFKFKLYFLSRFIPFLSTHSIFSLVDEYLVDMAHAIHTGSANIFLANQMNVVWHESKKKKMRNEFHPVNKEERCEKRNCVNTSGMSEKQKKKQIIEHEQWTWYTLA